MAIYKWFWDFGDGFFSLEQNPQHEYSRAGVFTVSLTIWDDGTGADTETKVAYVTVTENPNVTENPVTIRFATEPTEGEGWSEYDGEDWEFPAQYWAVWRINDENEVPRNLLLNESGQWWYELMTFDRVNILKPSPTDHGTEIDWEKWGREEVVGPMEEHDKLEHDVSHVYVRPEDSANRGQTGYDANGLRDDQELSIDDYVDGEKITPRATTDDIPDNGDAVFVGNKVEYRRHQLVVKGTASELRLVGINHEFIGKEKPGSRTERTMSERAIQTTLLSNLMCHVSRGRYDFNRVSKADLGNTYNSAAGPDGIDRSAAQLTTAMTLDNAATTGYSIVLWTQTAAPGPIAGVVMTEYATSGSWRLLYADAAGALAANLVVANTSIIYDLRVFSAQIADIVATVLPYIYTDVTQNIGKAIVPYG